VGTESDTPWQLDSAEAAAMAVIIRPTSVRMAGSCAVNPSNLANDVLEPSSLVDYFDSLFRYALKLTRNHAEAEDLVQETYVRTFQHMDSVRNPNSIKSWMFTILRNIWTSSQRRSKVASIDTEIDVSSAANAAIDSAGNAYVNYVRVFEVDLVRRALSLLSLETRQILILREYDELSYKAIADLLGCPVGTVMSRLARARFKLRTVLSTIESAQC
jgi:RNA polymerase sigma-70 factor (ECF subfamily)